MNAQTALSLKSHSRQARRPAPQRGVALLITLGLLALLGAASLAIIYLTSSDALINGYYRNYRGSFYAADSGINIVTEAMKYAVGQSANPVLGAAPLPITTAMPTGTFTMPFTGQAGPLTALTTAIAPYQAGYYSIGDTNSWNSEFKVIPNAGGVAVVGGTATAKYTITCPDNDANCQSDGNYLWSFSYPYEVTVIGCSSQSSCSALGSNNEQVVETGTITYTVSAGTVPSGGLPSFSHWATFIDQFALCQGQLVPGTTYGPAFSNGSWNFGNSSNPGYTFVGSIGQAATKVGYITGRGCTQGGATPPSGFDLTFDKGFTVGDPVIASPSDSYSQEQAVMDGKGLPPCTSTPCPTDPTPSQAQMAAVLSTVTGTPYSSSTTGVFIPMYQTTNAQGQPVTAFGSNPANGGDGAGGGFLVNGNASISLSATTDTGGHATQTYTITQGSGHSATTTTIVVDNTTNTTTVQQGSGSPLTLQGVPTQLNPNTGAPIVQDDPSGNPVNPTMIYVNGQITGLSGTIQNNTGITITSDDSVNITGNITYASQPVNSSDQLVSNTNAGVLGIYTRSDVNLEPSSNGGNLTIDASIAMLSGAATGTGTAGLETPANSVGALTIMGGRAEDQAHGVNMSSSTTLYDQRFAGNFGPPWFPTAVPTAGAGLVPGITSASITRTGWSEPNR
jgi:hypothetical protein